MVGSLIATAPLWGPAAIQGVSSLFGANAARKSSKDQERAAYEAARLQQEGIEKGIGEFGGYYDDANASINHLTPYMKGDDGWLGKTLYGSPEEQAAALSKYQGNPSAALFEAAKEDAVRRTAGQWASQRMGQSGAHVEDLGRRLSGMALEDYNKNWLTPLTGMYSTGAQASANAANIGSRNAMAAGDAILRARTGQGTAGASGVIGASNARTAGNLGANNYLQSFLGSASKMDFSKMFGGGGGSTQPGTAANGGWTTTVQPAGWW